MTKSKKHEGRRHNETENNGNIISSSDYWIAGRMRKYTGQNAADASEQKMKVAMVTDSGDITDQSFNQMTYEACKAWGKENDIEFNYYKPQSDSDEQEQQVWIRQ